MCLLTERDNLMDSSDYLAMIMFGLGIVGVVIITVMEILHRRKNRL